MGLRATACFAALLALLLFAISAQADEIEPEPEPAPIAEPEQPEPAPIAEPEPEPEPVEVTEVEDEGFARDGFYIAGNMAGSWYTDVKDDVREELTALGYTFPIEMEKPLGLGVRAGYRFLPRLAAEAQFQWFSGADVELDVKANKANAIQVETLTFTANLKAYLLTGRIQPFLLTGVGVMHLDADDKMNIGIKTSGDAFVARFGGGLDFYINDHFAFVVDGGYLLPTGSLDNLNQVVWSVGLQYRF
jgi:opacity protein-like surface antigen